MPPIKPSTNGHTMRVSTPVSPGKKKVYDSNRLSNILNDPSISAAIQLHADSPTIYDDEGEGVEVEAESETSLVHDVQDVQGVQVPRGTRKDVVSVVADYLGSYIVLPESSRIVTASWVVAAHLAFYWERFPHLAITSPEMRCGKTTFLKVLNLVVPTPCQCASITAAAVYRLIKKKKPTLILDEAQMLSANGNDAAAMLREIFCAGIDLDSKVYRCGGNRMDEVQQFPIYCPKIIALIGSLDSVLADRCVPIAMARKSNNVKVKRFFSNAAEPIGKEVNSLVAKWTTEQCENVVNIYHKLEPLDINNDRLAELLLPIQAVMHVAGSYHLDTLSTYADDLERQSKAAERQSPGVLLLTAIREIFSEGNRKFIATSDLISALCEREEEPWLTFTRGRPITAEALAGLLRPYDIRSVKLSSKTDRSRGYTASSFRDAWSAYLV